MKNGSENNCLVIGIGGISRAGKSTLTKALIEELKPIAVFKIDDYLINPIKKFDETIQNYIIDWEDPVVYDLEKFYLELMQKKEEINSTCHEDKKTKYIIAEGFLLYHRKDITDLLDFKIKLSIDKEICRSRRKNTKHYVSDHYFDEYIWKSFNENK